MPKDTRLVWDLPTRLFHWLLVLTIIGSYTTAKLGFEWTPWHMRLGYFALGLIIFRLIWGFIGPRHARFVNFLRGPGPIITYLRGGIKAVGHNPMGGWMVIVMLVLVALQAGTGLFATDDIAYTGPWYGAIGNDLAEKLTTFHRLNFNFILAAVGLHICAILFYTLVKRESLVPAMVHGHKAAEHVPDEEAITGHQLLKALLVIAVAAFGVWYLLHAAPPRAPVGG